MNRKLFLIAWLLAMLGVVAIMPYSLTIQSELLQSTPLPLPLPTLLLVGVLQSGLLLAVAK